MGEQVWRKSSYSGATHQNCLETAESPQAVEVRDTQNRELGRLSVSVAEWKAFIKAIKAGEFS
ncbi:DUF397 domain-containing protein [Allosalinactinospora lopnorensis]|uniref:DUF397 domain-containing protein n=1 Tax=Allosalinactinospora lopnorensis TaxID=1352348 RepID=UPI000623D5C7|nr:DUF397 domain-containing protein [Allosalinactinospora lopnorensis]